MTKLILCAIIALSLTGCFRAADLGQLRREIERELPEVQYERQIEMSFGSTSMGFARLVTFFVPPSWWVRGMLSEIRAVKVGVYTARHTPFRQDLGNAAPRSKNCWHTKIGKWPSKCAKTGKWLGYSTASAVRP